MQTNIHLINQQIALEEASFKRKNFVQSSLKVNVKDSLEEIKVQEKNISFIFIRKAELDPASLFEVVIKISYKATLDDQSFNLMMSEKKLLGNDDYIRIVNNTNIPQTASMIIANLTSINGANPLITSPIFIKQS